MKRASLIFLTFDPDLPIHHADQLRRNRQPQTRATVLACGGHIHLRKCFEQTIQLVGWNAYAGVRNREMQTDETVLL